QGNFDGAVFDSTTDDDTLKAFADELIEDDPEYAENDIDREKIFVVLRDLANNGDHTLSEWQLKDRIIPKEASDGSGSDDEEQEESDESEESDDDAVSDTIMIGKREFDRNEWHHTVKETIKRTIGVKKLSRLAYGDTTHHNFDFWIGRDGRI